LKNGWSFPVALGLSFWLLCSSLLCPTWLHAVQSLAANDSPDSEIGILVLSNPGEAADALRQLKAGSDFGVLAKEKSIDPTSNDGGSMGRLDPSQLRPELRDALHSLKPGQFSEVVAIPSGFAILTIFPPRKQVDDLHPERIKALVASGVVRYGIDVSGNTEENTAFDDYPKPEGWNRDLPEVCSLRKQAHAAALERMDHVMEAAEGGAGWERGARGGGAGTPPPPGAFSPIDKMQAHGVLSELHAFVGDMDEAIAEAKAAYQIAVASAPEAVPYLAETIGALYLHKAEMENGVYRDSGNEDFFPPLSAGTAPFAKPEDSRAAIEYFMLYLHTKPDDLEVRWLLNLAYMTLGEYPAKVPAAYLISAGADPLRPKDSSRFIDVGRATGLNVFSEAGGIVVEDFDNDGLLDVATSSMDVCEPMHLFHNNGDGTFTDRAKEAGLADQLGGLNLVAADYNNDGCMDLLVLRGGWEFPVRKSLLRNNCNGTFTDATDASGLGGTVTRSQTAAWADINNDGYLDLFIGNENAPSQLFRNRGDGTFEDISHQAGIDQTAYTKGVTTADYDNDGYMDFYVSNIGGANFLYHNNHDLTFTEVGKQAGVQSPYFSFATWFFDYDNDGWPDLFVTSYFDSVDEAMRSAQGLPVHVETLRLYRNLQNGAFEDVTEQVGLDKVFMPMGSNFGDIDNDGFLDIYLGQGQPSFTGILPHVLLRNDEGKRFVDITASTGTGELHKGHGVAFADLERRGYQDILAETGGAVFSDKHTMRVFENPGNGQPGGGPGAGNDWINVRLSGVKSNRGAVGAQIKVTVKNDGQASRSIYRRVGETSSFGVNPLEQHIGLGHAAQIVALEIWWPATNTRQHFDRVDKNEYIAISEFATTYNKLKRTPYRLGAPAGNAAK
jgi:hypothetical protein